MLLSSSRRHTLLFAAALLCAACIPAWSQVPGDAVALPDTIGAPPPAAESSEKTYGTIPLRHFFFPRPLETWDRQWLVGTTLVIIPREVAEEQLRQAPMIDGRLQLGLPLNFHARARLSTNVITTYGAVGGGWNVRLGNRLAVGADAEWGYWYGFANFEGFDISAQGLLFTPTVSAGLALDEFLVSVQGDAQVNLWRRTESNGIDVTQELNALASYGLGVSVEQPLVGHRHIAVGIKVNYARQMYQAWLAFATFNEYLLYPEFSLHLLF